MARPCCKVVFVNAVPLPGAYAPPLRYLILDATGGVTGTFDGLAQRRAFFTAGFDYQPNQVFLVFSPLPFNNPATCVSHNTCAVTAALDAATPSAGPGIVQLLQALAPLSDTEALAALNSFTGDMHPTLASLALEEQALLGQSITRRLGALRGRGGSGASAGPSMSPLLLAALDNTGERLAQMAAAASPTGESLPRQGAWGQVYGVDGKRDNDGNAAGGGLPSVGHGGRHGPPNARRLGDRRSAQLQPHPPGRRARRRPWRAERL